MTSVASAADTGLLKGNTKNPCVDPNGTLTYLSSSTSGTPAVQVIAAATGKKIHICSMSVVGVSGTNPTFSLVYGTGSNCATGQTVLVPAFATTAAAIYSFHGPVAIVPSSNALCYLDAGTTPVQSFIMTYIQQ